MTFLDRFTPDRLLAERGPVVTRLMRAANGERVVVKTLSVKRARDAREIELFEREAGILKHLQHPAVPKFVDFATEDRGAGEVELHLVQSFVDGKSLDVWIREGRSFTAREAREMMRALAEVLAHLHGASPALVHRDIKPSNVVRNDAGSIFLVDFGAAKRAARDGTAVGTFGYMAPEQLEGRATPASDVFGVGMTMVHVLTHLEPEQFADDGGVRKAWRRRANVADETFAALIDDCIAVDEERRPRDGAALLEQLGSAQAPRAVAAIKPAHPARQATPVIAASIVALLLGLGAALWLSGSDGETATSSPAPADPAVSPPQHRFPLTPQKVPPSVRLGVPGLLENIECLSRADRALQSEQRYRSWRKGDDAPTCTERYVTYGLYELYDDAPERCATAAAAAQANTGARDAAQELADALTALTPVVANANSYYDAEDYKDDACAKGTELHAQLIPGFARVRAAYASTLAAQEQLAQGGPPEDEKLAAYRKLLDAALRIGRAARMDPSVDTAQVMAERKAAVVAYEEAAQGSAGVRGIGVNIESLKKWARGSNDLGAAMSIGGIEESTASAIEMKLIFE